MAIRGSRLLKFACDIIVVPPKLHVLALFFVWFIWHVYWQRNDGNFLVCHEVVIVGFHWGPPLSLCNSQLNPRINHWSSVCQSQRTWLSRPLTGHALCPWPRRAKTGACAYCCMSHVKWMVPVCAELPSLHSSCTVCMFHSAAKQLKCHFCVHRRCHSSIHDIVCVCVSARVIVGSGCRQDPGVRPAVRAAPEPGRLLPPDGPADRQSWGRLAAAHSQTGDRAHLCPRAVTK